MKLSAREIEVLRLTCEGLTWKEIALELGTTPYTVMEFKRRIRAKTGCSKVATLVMWAVANEIVNPRISIRRRAIVSSVTV
jgi:DNA-binding NarL/FixJ family response regulator